MSASPVIGAQNSNLSSLLPYLQMLQGASSAYGGLRNGSVSQGLRGVTGIAKGYQGLNPSTEPSTASTSQEPTVQSKFGMSRDEFMSLDPELRQRMLERLMGR